jgi:cytochrome b6-f complex iron-sulfur subunit
MHRKDFIKTCSIFCLGGTALASFLQSCGTSSHVAQSVLSENRIAVKKSEFTEINNKKKIERKYVLVKTEKLEFPVCIYRQNENDYTALYMQCTHRGCELKPNNEYVVCPCHGSEFSNKGIVQNPPAENNLKQFQITSDNENIYILL